MDPAQHDRLDYIDALRGFAIFGVIFNHAVELVGVTHRVILPLGIAAGNGVLLFFVVSACTIFLTLTKGAAREVAPFRNFFIKRLMRLLPVYWIGIVLYAAIYGLGSRFLHDGPELWHFPLHATLTNDLYPGATSSVVPGGWSISCEALFYLTVPLWFVLVRNTKAALVFVGAAFLFAPIAVRMLRHVIDPAFPPMESAVLDQYWFRSLPNQLPIFSLGILLYFVTRDRPAPMRALANPATNLGVLIAGGAILLVGSFADIPHVPWHYPFGIGFFLAALALSQRPWRLLVNRATTFLGRISYSAYLIHFLVLRTAQEVIPQGSMSATGYAAVILLASLPVTMLMAYAGFNLVEKPTSAIAKRWIQSAEQRGAVA